MRILFDIVHPAHVHFFKHMITGLESKGHETIVVGRDKDVTRQLLSYYGIEHTSIGQAGRKGRVGQLAELLQRDVGLWRIVRRFKPEIVVTRNPAGVQAARLAGATGIFDTDDGSAAGIHFRAAAPFAHWITTPDCHPEDFGAKHIKYPGYKQTAYLHPEHFTPNAAVLTELGLEPKERYFLVRFVSMTASHDAGEAGMNSDLRREIIRRLSARGRVYLTSEGVLPSEWEALRAPIHPYRMHDAIAYATLLVGDSQTMAAEAAVLGTPNLRISSFAGRISYLEELEHKYGLTYAYSPNQVEEIQDRLDEMLDAHDLRGRMQLNRVAMLRDKKNIADWYAAFIENIAG